MKRSAIWGVLAVVIAVSGIGLSAWAQGGKAIFEASLAPGLFPTPSESGFVKGSVKGFADGTVQVSVVGAQPNETYNVLAGILVVSFSTDVPPVESDIISWTPLAGSGAQLTTDGKGEGTASGRVFSAFDKYAFIVFALDDADNEENTSPSHPIGPNRYLTRFH